MKNTRCFLLSVLILISGAVQALAYCHPDEGRWLSRDPMQEQGGVNLYGFVLNDALNHYDSVGLVCQMYLNADPSTPYGSVANMVCTYSCCKCKQVQFKQWATTSIGYVLYGVIPIRIDRPRHYDSNTAYYDEDYSHVDCKTSSGNGFAGMGDRPGFDKDTWYSKLTWLNQDFETEAVCTDGPDAGKVYARWTWWQNYSTTPPYMVSRRGFSPVGAIPIP